MTRALLQTLVLGLALLAPITAHGSESVIRLATTTSTDNSGLLDYLLPTFEEHFPYKVHVVSVGTGKALRMGKDGDADVLLVHAPAAEQKFMAAGYGVDRREVMYNDFVVVGPVTDPADIADSTSVAEALSRIVARQTLFLSRGDDSGTHKKELSLWRAAALEPDEAWYREAGQGMGRVLQMAGELQAYTIADRGTWIAFKDKLPLALLFQGDPPLHNPYGIMAVNPARYRDINYAGAKSLIEWITSPEGQRKIDAFRMNGERLFTPLAIESNHE